MVGGGAKLMRHQAIPLEDLDSMDLEQEVRERGGIIKWGGESVHEWCRDELRDSGAPEELLRGLELWIEGSLTELMEWCASRKAKT